MKSDEERVPYVHKAQAMDPAALYLPAVQEVGLDVASAHCDPAGHTVQASDPVESEYLPAGQAWHRNEPAGANVPAGQASGAAEGLKH